MYVLQIVFLCLVFGRELALAFGWESSCLTKILKVQYTNDSDVVIPMEKCAVETICKNLRARLDVLDQQLGRVKFTVLIPNRCDDGTMMPGSSHKVELFPKGSEHEHSEVKFIPSTELWGNYSKFKVLEWETDYVMKGIYKLKIDSTGGIPCSRKLNITTDYVMEKINLPKPTISRHYASQISTTLTVKARGKHPPEQVLFELKKGDDNVNVVTLMNTGGCCHRNNCSIPKDKCMCVSNNNKLLDVDCTFENTLPGNYTVYMTFQDIRCCEQTLWNPNPQHCVWYSAMSLKNETVDNIVDTPAPPDYTILVVLGVVLFICCIATVILIVYLKTSSRIIKRFSPLSLWIQQTASDEQRPKVLLAYPRDCELFMETMAEFRKTLKERIKGEVYDVYDPDLFESIAEKKERWPLQYCYDQNVKVILMATHSSRLIYNAFMKGDEIEYDEPQPFDKVFLLTMKSIMEISITDMPYNRIFVVRLDGNDLEENTFTFICPFTVYTIPQQLNTLALSIRNSSHSGIGQTINADGLSSLIDKFNWFKNDNPGYFEKMVHLR